MATIIVIGAGVGGIPAALEVRKAVRKEDRVLVIADSPTFHFTPSNPRFTRSNAHLTGPTRRFTHPNHRFTTSTQQYSNSIQFQLELKGLSNVGSGADSFLHGSIQGYSPQ